NVKDIDDYEDVALKLIIKYGARNFHLVLVLLVAILFARKLWSLDLK
ncbi:22312_t:CDS:1, partial [Entrophospora sp. SA101]